ILAVLIFAHDLRRSHRLPGWREWAAFVTLPAIWYAAHLLHFGHLGATTLAAKRAQGQSGAWLLFHQDIVRPFYTVLGPDGRQAVVLLLAAAAWGLGVALVQRDVAALLIAALGGLHFGVYTWLRVPAYYWYYGFVYLGVIYLAAFGARGLGRQATVA